MTDVSYAVLLHGEHVGTIQRRDADTTFAVFAFDRDYWNRRTGMPSAPGSRITRGSGPTTTFSPPGSPTS